ncbi:hypothetical protein AB0M22_32525 [Nocardia sp. NPDC051756]|uniref:hypothetical protein n=1 Tax=Nocardia sp. NPDC051756 TaxID=3154751 RepID=UPI0034216C69
MTIDPTDWVPDSCTLPTAQRPMRVAEFDQFFTDAVQRAERPGRTRLDLLIDTDAVPLGRDLAARETDCCSFFTFTFEPAAGGSVLHIDVPLAHVEVLDALETRIGTASR